VRRTVEGLGGSVKVAKSRTEGPYLLYCITRRALRSRRRCGIDAGLVSLKGKEA
jgi:hypothetical protein